jgi:hypothetical protein
MESLSSEMLSRSVENRDVFGGASMDGFTAFLESVSELRLQA